MKLQTLALSTLLCLILVPPASSLSDKPTELAWIPGEPDLVMVFTHHFGKN